MFSEMYPADLAGARVSFVAFAAAAVLAGLLMAWRMRRSRRGLQPRSGLALAVLVLSAVGFGYWWLFAGTFYRLRAGADELVLQLELPRREVRIPRTGINRFALEPALRGAARMVIETTSGQRYYSPPGPRTNRLDAIERAEELLIPDMNQLAERYVRLVLQVGQHDADFVDAYYGPDALKPSGDKAPLETLLASAATLQREAAAFPLPDDADEITRLRKEYLSKQLLAVQTRLRMLKGDKLPFDEESRLLYDAAAPVNPDASFQSTLDEIDKRLPGSGALIDRYDRFRSAFVIPTDRLDRVFRLAIDECRTRTRAHLPLPEGETFTVEYVTGKSWSAYNWYKGGFRSVIQVNTDLPVAIDRAIDLACHEGYPGHHVYNALLEKYLVRDRRWMEFSVYPLFSPQSLIAEGTANYGIAVAFPGDTRTAFEKATLFPAAGLDASRAAEYYAVQALVDRLSYACNEAARRYLNGEITREQAVAWLERYAMMPKARAEQRTRFFDQYRSYVINYNLGKDLAGAWVEKQAATPEERWKVFGRLLSSPRLPSGLR
ncbi:MAG: hypothetical protein M3R55_03605 [Acidobacteriota bacterium]|nr:hypothetical protein [Acidobacteriota bacterium]